jgi:hypothetical protein
VPALSLARTPQAASGSEWIRHYVRVSEPSEPTPAVLVWVPMKGSRALSMIPAATWPVISGRRTTQIPTVEWSYTIWDYQNNRMLTGVAPTLARAQEAVATWDRDVVASGNDPSRAWANDDE